MRRNELFRMNRSKRSSRTRASEVLVLKKSILLQKENYERKIEELKENLNKKDETIRSTPIRKNRVLNETSLLVSNVREDILNNGAIDGYKEKLKKSMLETYNRGRNVSMKAIEKLKSKLQDSEKKIRKMREKLESSGEIFKKEEGKKKQLEIETEECCVIL